jgi:hypothetical protein
MKKFSFSVLILFISLNAFTQDLFDPKNTHIVIAGVLKWKDPSVSTFSDHHRKDQELYDQFIEMGVPKSNIVIMLDNEATLKAMQDNINAKMEACDEKSTFIFYYAGHGVKAGKKYYFCNYDMGAKAETRFDVSFLSIAASKKFKGKRIILMADCCYSGSLLKEGEKISKKGKQVVVMSSATSSNISTGNWTYTQTILDNFRGESEGDHDKSGDISLKELSVEIKDAMKYRERQLNGFATYDVDAEKTIVQKLAKGEKKEVKTLNDFTTDQYVYALSKGNWKPARIKAMNYGDITVEFYDYSDKREEIIEKKFVRSIQTPDYSKLTKVEVEWEKKFYKSTIKKSDGDFYFIQYDGYDESYNEWVMYDRIKTGNEKNSKVEWNTGWYDGIILQEKDNKYFVTYKGYDHTWDEWVTKDRIK